MEKNETFMFQSTETGQGPERHDGRRSVHNVPDVQKSQLSRTLHVKLIRQLFEEVMERGSKLLAGVTFSGRKEKQEDSVLQAQDHFPLCVQLLLVFVVLHQNVVVEQIHHPAGKWEPDKREACRLCCHIQFRRPIQNPKSP